MHVRDYPAACEILELPFGANEIEGFGLGGCAGRGSDGHGGRGARRLVIGGTGQCCKSKGEAQKIEKGFHGDLTPSSQA